MNARFFLTIRLLLLASASIALYCGFGELLLVPHAPGEAYWATERFLYGVIPLFLGVHDSDNCGMGSRD